MAFVPQDRFGAISVVRSQLRLDLEQANVLGPLRMPRADDLRAEAIEKRQTAAQVRDILPYLSMPNDRALFQRHAAELEAEAASLEERANNLERDP